MDGDRIDVPDIEDVELLKAVGFVADDSAESNPCDSLKDEIGGAVGVFDGSPHNANPGNRKGCFSWVIGLLHGNAKHAVGVQRLFQHGAVSRLEDEKRKHRLGKQDGAAKDHDSSGVGYEHGRGYFESHPLQVSGRVLRRLAGRKEWPPVNARLVGALLVVLSLGLGAGLYFVQDKATKERRAAAEAADQLKAELVRSETKLSEQIKVNASLETNLTRRIEEVGLYSTKLDFVSSELSKVEAEAKASAAKARLELEEREKKIVGLQGEKDDLTQRLDELNLKITGLNSQIRETERKLATSEGDREVLKKELRRMLTEKAELEKRFADISEVREQVRRLREEAYLARRMEIIRKGVINFDQKGATLLQQGIRRGAATNAPAKDARLNVEINPDGSSRVLPNQPVQK